MNLEPRDCPPKERLFDYAEMQAAEEDSATKLHLSECDRCRQLVEDYRGVDTLLEGWNAPEPSPEFDFRVRAAIERARSSTWLGRGHRAMYRAWDRMLVWAQGMPSPVHRVALAVVLVVVVSSAVVLVRVRGKGISNRGTAHLPAVLVPNREASGSGSAPAIGEVARDRIPSGMSSTADAGPGPQDDEMLANFDVLSELPVPHERVQQRDN
jgi:hypothetical protein